MNLLVDLSFAYKAESVSVKIVDKFLFIEACEFHGIKGVDCTKRFFKTCKKVDLTTPPESLKAFYKKGKIRLGIDCEKKRGEASILISITHAKVKRPKREFVTMKGGVTHEQLMESLRQMGMIQ